MNPKRTHFKALSVLLSFLLLYSLTVLPVNASAGTIYESESNNTYGTADITYDDYDNYGSLPANDVADWWKISITAEGIANFYLGNIPSGCNYDLQLYDYTGTKVLIESLKASNKFELVKCHVRAGETYYIRVFRDSYPDTLSSANYQLRIKLYDLQDANIYTYSCKEDMNTSPMAYNFTTYANSMGFSSSQYNNQPASAIYQSMPNNDILVVANHAEPGKMQCDKDFFDQSFIYAKVPSDELSEISQNTDNAILSNYTASSLSNVKLVIYVGCSSASTSSSYGNLVDMTIQKGAFNCIGWGETIYLDDAKGWLKNFMYYCSRGNNLGISLAATNNQSELLAWDDSILNIYYGSSRLYSTLLS